MEPPTGWSAHAAVCFPQRLVTWRLTPGTRQSTTRGPLLSSLYPPPQASQLGSHAQKLAVVLLPCGAQGWHLPLAEPGFCLLTGSPARASTLWVSLSLRSALQTGMGRTLCLPQTPPGRLPPP